MAFEILEDRATPATLSNFLTVEHVDIEIGYSGGPTGEWTITAHDDENDIEHEASDALLYVGADALTTRSGGDGLGFVGVAPGESFFHLTQSQDPDRLYLGFSAFSSSDFDTYDVTTESGGRSSGQGQWLKVSLVDVEHTNPDGTPGTGKFSVWQENLSVPVPFMVSSDGIAADDALWITASGHLHYNFGFSQAGRYEVSLKTSGYYIPGGGANSSLVEGTYTESDPIKVYFSVNSVGQIQFDSANTAVNEQAGYRTIPVKRVGGSDGQITINYATSDGTATLADGDYVSTSGTLTFADGETEKVITVQVANAGVDVANETFNLTLTVPVSAGPGDTGYLNSHLLSTVGDDLLGTNATTAITINDTPTITGISGQTTTIGNPTAPIAFTIGDAETLPENITLSATSSNPHLVPISNIVFGGSGASRTVTVTPAAGLSGSSRIYIIAKDENGAEITANFTLQVGNATAGTAVAIDGSTPTNSVPNVVLGADDSFTLNYTVANSAWVTNVTFVEFDNANLIGAAGTGSTSDLRTQPTAGGTARTLRIRGRDNSTAAGEYGTANVTLGFTGSGAPANTHTFNLRVNPRAVADNWLLAIPGTTSTFDVLANDAKPIAGHAFTITAVSGASNGTLTVAPDGKTLRYNPTNLATGVDRFTYTVTVNSSDAFNGYSFTGQASVKIGGYAVIDSPTASQHIDLDFDYSGGVWTQNIRTDAVIVGSVESGTFGPSTYDADEGVIFFDPSTKQPRGSSSILDALGVPAGADVWFGPTSSSGNKLYLGIANESTTGIDSYIPIGDPRAAFNAEWVRTDLVGFSGPGHFTAFNGSDVAFDTYDGLNSPSDATSGGNVSDTFWGFAGSHAHPAWYFTAPGKYELTFRSTVRVGGEFLTSPDTTFTFYVDTISGNARLTENPPLALNDAATVDEDSGLTVIDVLANDSSSADPFEVLTVTGVTQGSHGGTVAIAGGGANVTYEPAANFFGTETFTYTVADEHGGVATATVTVTVSALNDTPASVADSFSVTPGNSVRGNVLFNDSDADGDPLTAVLVTGAAKGSVVLNADGTFTYTPGTTFNGADSFTYRAGDGSLQSAETTVTINLPGGQHFDAALSTGHVDIGVAYEGGWDLHVHDEENDAEYEPYHVVLHVGAAAITTRSGGLAGSEFDFLGAGAGQTLYWLPETENPELIYLGFGAEEVNGGTFQGGQLKLRLKAVNGPGHFSAWQSTDLGPTVAMATSDGITAADFVTLLEEGHEHYNFAFTTRGTYDVTFEAYATLADGTVTSSGDVTYRFVVNTGADAADDGYSVDEDSTLTVGGPGVLGNDVDPDGDSLVSTLVQGPANGTVTVNPDGSFTYVPNANFSGTDTFTYSVTDVRYRIVPLGTLGGNNSFALDVNNDRQVSGNSSITAGSSNPLQAYVWQNGTFLPLGVLPGTGSNNFSRGYAINDAGVVVGESDNSTSKAFVWNDGIMSGLTRLAGDNFNGAAHDINGAGAIVGISSNGTTSRPTIWTFNGTTYVAADLGTIAGTATSTGRGWAINDAGQVVGLSHNEEGTSQATLWSGGTITNLGSLGDGERFSQAYGLNNHGDVVGSSSTGQTVGQLIGTTSTTSITRAFYWHDEHMHELLPYNFYAPGNTGATTNYHSEAKDINDAGLVVGNSARIAGSAANATLWEHGAVMDLNALIPTGSGWVLRGAEGINQGGDIVGFGSFGGFTRAFLLVPEVVSLDGRLFSNTATVTITVNGTPDAPVAADDAYAVGAGSSVHGNVLFNDSDPDGDPVSVVSSTAAAKGMVVLQANGSFVYTPGASFDGTDSFTYTISDGFGGTDTATVTISLATLPDFEAVLSQGHADIGIFAGSNDTIIDHGDHTHVIEGEFGWDLHVHDHDNDVEYEPDEVLFVVGSAGEAPRPAGIGYDFLGVAAGMPVWTLPQTENPSVPFLGIGTEEIADGTFDADVVSFELVAVDGPGHMSLWTDDATPTVFFATSDGITSADATVLPTGGHAHFNWSFTAPGRYAVTVQARGNVAGEGSSVSDPVTYYFDVVSPPSAPIVTEVAPFVGPTTGGTLVIITGTGFTGATDVSFGGVSGTDVTISPDGTQITVTAPAHGAGTVEVVVTTPGGSNDTAGAANDYTYYVNPAVTSVVINQGTAPITNYSLSGNVVTVTTAGNTTYMAGQKILIAGMANPANNGSFEVQTASTGSNTFTFLNTNIGASSAGFGGTVTAIGGTGSLGTGGVGSQRSMVDSVVYTFNAPVTLGPNAFTLAVNSGVSVGTAPTVNYASPDGGTTWVVTFSGAGVTGNSIADGVYDITFNGSALTSLGTIANRTDTFLRRFGDINGNGIVTGLGDFNPFKAALGTSTGSTAYVAAFDFGANGSITGLGDFNPFNARLGLPAWTGFTVTI